MCAPAVREEGPEFYCQIQTGEHRNCICNNLSRTKGTCTSPQTEGELVFSKRAVLRVSSSQAHPKAQLRAEGVVVVEALGWVSSVA